MLYIIADLLSVEMPHITPNQVGVMYTPPSDNDFSYILLHCKGCSDVAY